MVDNFLWGTAASAYQIEGTDPDDGRGRCIWDTFAEEGRIFGHHNADVACDHMHRYKEDYKLMGQFGMKAYRFSISWARIIPDGTGAVNEKAIALYRDMITEMLANGIEPWLTLYHWELPQALQNRGGWLNPESVQWFGNYARIVAERFSDLVTHYFTLNEPQCFTGLGYLRGEQAPGLKVSMSESFQVVHNALMAHGNAVRQMRDAAKQPIQIGFAPTCGVAIPASDKPEDIEAAKQVYFGFYQPDDNWTWNVAWFSDPVFLGHYPEEGLKKYHQYLPKFTQADLDLISQPLDFMGQNVYNGYPIRMGADGKPEDAERKPGYPKTSCGWPITPECLYWAIRFQSERYKMPMYITENGMACHDAVSLDGKVHDPNRIDFLHRYMLEVKRAMKEGADVRGYFLWTFLDNFEWVSGYSERFGLVYVDYETQQRIPKDSAYWYRDVIANNGANL